jgi:hypothetical protein
MHSDDTPGPYYQDGQHGEFFHVNMEFPDGAVYSDMENSGSGWSDQAGDGHIALNPISFRPELALLSQ